MGQSISRARRKRPTDAMSDDDHVAAEKARPDAEPSQAQNEIEASVEEINQELERISVDATEEIKSNKYLQFPFLVDRATREWVAAEHVMFVLRGLSGSGKSTVVDAIRKTYPAAVVCSADDFFMRHGRYKFNVKLLKKAHEACQSKASEACQSRAKPVVIDNTNVTRWEMDFYFKLAHKEGYRVVVVEPQTPWRLDAAQLAKRNTHGVPEEVLRSKVEQFKFLSPMYYAWFLSLADSAQLLALAKRWLTVCLEQCERFRADVRRYPEADQVCWSLLDYFSRDALTDSQRDILHCTAKFCGRTDSAGDAERYAKSVAPHIGRVFSLRVTSFVITKDTFGARVQLDERMLELYGQNDDEPLSAKQFAAAKKASSARREGVSGDASEGERRTSLRWSDAATEADGRFCAVPGRGRRAHLTLGTAPGVRPVSTGLDAIEAARREKDDKDADVDRPRVEGAFLRNYDDGMWIVYPDQSPSVEAIFAGHY